MQSSAPRPPCPNCHRGYGRWLKLTFINRGQACFTCVTCGHCWAVPLTLDANAAPSSPQILDVSRRRRC